MDHESWIRLGGTLLFASLWQSTALTACARLTLLLVPSVSAKKRFLLWSLSFALCVLLPVLEFCRMMLHLTATTPMSSNVPGAVGTLQVGMTFTCACLSVWVVLTLISLLRLCWSIWTAKSLVETAWQAPAPLQNLQSKILGQLRKPELLISEKISSPVAAGFRRPAVVLPARLLQSLSEEQAVALLRHEIQHLVRYDHWTALLFRSLQALFPLMPALWYIDRKLAATREEICDREVLAFGISPHEYANCIVTSAEFANARGSGSFLPGLLGQRSQLAARLDRILSPTKPRKEPWGFSFSTGVLLVAMGGLLFGTPDLIIVLGSSQIPTAYPVRSSPELSDEGIDYLESPSLTPSTPSYRPPSMPHIPLPESLRLKRCARPQITPIAA